MAKIGTTKGDLEETLLKKQVGSKDDDVEKTDWTEYWQGGTNGCAHTHDFNDPTRMCTNGCGAELVHRSVNMKLKKNVIGEGIAAMLK